MNFERAAAFAAALFLKAAIHHQVRQRHVPAEAAFRARTDEKTQEKKERWFCGSGQVWLVKRESRGRPDDSDNTELNPETCIYFDIETTGLKAETSHLYLIGYAVQKKPGSWEIRQLFAERTEDERDLLKAFSDICMRYRTVIHFNGDRFDIPYLETKYQEYSMPSPFRQMDTADIYRMVRPYKDLCSTITRMCLECCR